MGNMRPFRGDRLRQPEEFPPLCRRDSCGAPGNDIEVFLFSDIAPVPLLSFSIGQLNASMGVMITASHNPRIFNGLVYNSSGYQIVGEEADSILKGDKQAGLF